MTALVRTDLFSLETYAIEREAFRAAVANLSAQGLMPLEPTAALAALGEVVRQGAGQATVLKANWQRAAKMLGGMRLGQVVSFPMVPLTEDRVEAMVAEVRASRP